LNIYFDNRWPSGSGIGVVARELATRLAPRHNLVDLEVPGSIGSPLSPLRVQRALKQAAVAKDDVFWNPGFIPPVDCLGKSVITVHDLTHLHFYPMQHRVYYNLVLKRLYKRCTAIVTVSEYTKREFCEWSGYQSDNVHVIYNAVSDVFLKNTAPADLGFKYILYPGNYRAYKNLARLMQAYSQSDLPGMGIKLVITGRGDDQLSALADSLDIADNFVATGFLEEQQLAEMYRGALAIAFVSLYEGFGLPILEGMASGVPVVTSNASAMPEVAGNAAIIVDPYSVSSIRSGLERVIKDDSLRRELIQLGGQRIKKFSWTNSAKQLESLLFSISGNRLE
jgi:glycosyltransferase involved in cell wall biosynthesis